MPRQLDRSAAGVVVLAIALFSPATLLADPATDARLDRIERQLESRGLIDMLNQLEQLQRDVQQLRGELEVQAHRTADMQNRQREQYLDIDRRLQQLETGLAPAPATPPEPIATTPGLTAPPPATGGPGMASTGTASPATEQAEYDKALAILREGRYTEAAAAFNRFLTDHPGSSYADNASYWLGETYYVTRDFDRAMTTFSKLVEFHPASPKVPDTRLKIGFIHYENQNWPAAREELTLVVNEYPGTTAARLASDRLQRMQKEGH
ncbi:MAG: tol-pal system protein YbgF [Gammaproteobacteria bacterium]|nr:MAG: tol-pal system protein YbgF [Gammaproteobacteria bacterium]